MSKLLDRCFRCKQPLEPLTFAQQVELTQNYREFFEDTWQDEDPVRVCMPCFYDMEELHNSGDCDCGEHDG